MSVGECGAIAARRVPAAARASLARPVELPGRDLHRRRARAPRARTSRTSTARSSRSSTCPRRSRARCSPATRATRARCGGCSSTSSPTRCRRGRRAWDGAEGDARRRALRAHLPRLRRRLGRPARRRARRLRVGLQRADEGAAAPAPGRLPRAVHALHRLRRADARRRLPLLPRPDARARTYERAMDELFDIYAAALPRGDRVGRRGSSRRPRTSPARARARGAGQGARPPARPAARRVAVAHGHLRHGPDLRAAHPAPARPPAARGARTTGA